MQQTTQRSYYQGPEDDQPQQKQIIYHIYREEIDTEDQAPVIETEGDPQPENKYPVLGVVLSIMLVLLCVGIPYLTYEWLPQVYQNTYDTTLSRTLTLTLAARCSS